MAASLIFVMEDRFVGFVRVSVVGNGFMGSWKRLMRFSGRSVVGLVAEREGEIIDGGVLQFGVNFPSATATDIDVSFCGEVGSETARVKGQGVDLTPLLLFVIGKAYADITIWQISTDMKI